MREPPVAGLARRVAVQSHEQCASSAWRPLQDNGFTPPVQACGRGRFERGPGVRRLPQRNRSRSNSMSIAVISSAFVVP